MAEPTRPERRSPTIDVLIATRGSREMVLACLSQLGLQTVEHSVFVADNGGDQDGTTTAIRRAFPEAAVITFAHNQGFGRAMNHLASRGHSDVIVLINDDVDVAPEFLERLVAPLRDPGIGMCAGMTMQPLPDEVVDGFGIEVDPTLLAYNRLRHRHPCDTPGVLLGPSGGAAAYRRGAWEAVGGFEPSLFVYAEDLDLALRLRLAGWRAAGAPDARALHLGGATAGLDSSFQRWHAGFGRGFVLRRYGVMRTRHGPRALLIELVTVLYGLRSAGSLIPLRSRVAGWRAAGPSPRRAIPADGIDPGISLRETLRRLRWER